MLLPRFFQIALRVVSAFVGTAFLPARPQHALWRPSAHHPLPQNPDLAELALANPAVRASCDMFLDAGTAALLESSGIGFQASEEAGDAHDSKFDTAELELKHDFSVAGWQVCWRQP